MTILHERCGRCNRKLKNEQSRLLGYGKSCYKKYRTEKAKKEYEERQIKLETA